MYWYNLHTTAGVSTFPVLVAAGVQICERGWLAWNTVAKSTKTPTTLWAYIPLAIVRLARFMTPLLQIRGAARVRISWRPIFRRLPSTHRERASARLDSQISARTKTLVRESSVPVNSALTSYPIGHLCSWRCVVLLFRSQSDWLSPVDGAASRHAPGCSKHIYSWSKRVAARGRTRRLHVSVGVKPPTRPIRRSVQARSSAPWGRLGHHGAVADTALRRRGCIVIDTRVYAGSLVAHRDTRGVRMAGVHVGEGAEGGRCGRLTCGHVSQLFVAGLRLVRTYAACGNAGNSVHECNLSSTRTRYLAAPRTRTASSCVGPA
jgi:hypothetical protein